VTERVRKKSEVAHAFEMSLFWQTLREAAREKEVAKATKGAGHLPEKDENAKSFSEFVGEGKG